MPAHCRRCWGRLPGAGGTFAIYSLLSRAIGIGPHGQQLPEDESIGNYYKWVLAAGGELSESLEMGARSMRGGSAASSTLCLQLLPLTC